MKTFITRYMEIQQPIETPVPETVAFSPQTLDEPDYLVVLTWIQSHKCVDLFICDGDLGFYK